MSISRRGFLGAILAAGMAPAIAKVGVLMPVKTLIAHDKRIILWGDGYHDDTRALQAWADGKEVLRAASLEPVNPTYLSGGIYKFSDVIKFPAYADRSIHGCAFIGDVSPAFYVSSV